MWLPDLEATCITTEPQRLGLALFSKPPFLFGLSRLGTHSCPGEKVRPSLHDRHLTKSHQFYCADISQMCPCFLYCCLPGLGRAYLDWTPVTAPDWPPGVFPTTSITFSSLAQREECVPDSCRLGEPQSYAGLAPPSSSPLPFLNHLLPAASGHRLPLPGTLSSSSLHLCLGDGDSSLKSEPKGSPAAGNAEILGLGMSAVLCSTSLASCSACFWRKTPRLSCLAGFPAVRPLAD